MKLFNELSVIEFKTDKKNIYLVKERFSREDDKVQRFDNLEDAIKCYKSLGKTAPKKEVADSPATGGLFHDPKINEKEAPKKRVRKKKAE